MEDESLQRVAPAGCDQEPQGGPSGDECLLHGMTTRDDLLAVGERLRRERDGGRRGTAQPRARDGVPAGMTVRSRPKAAPVRVGRAPRRAASPRGGPRAAVVGASSRRCAAAARHGAWARWRTGTSGSARTGARRRTTGRGARLRVAGRAGGGRAVGHRAGAGRTGAGPVRTVPTARARDASRPARCCASPGATLVASPTGVDPAGVIRTDRGRPAGRAVRGPGAGRAGRPASAHGRPSSADGRPRRASVPADGHGRAAARDPTLASGRERGVRRDRGDGRRAGTGRRRPPAAGHPGCGRASPRGRLAASDRTARIALVVGPAAGWTRGRQASAGASAAPPALAVARVLHQHAGRSQLVAQAVGRRPVARHPGRGSRVEQRRDLGRQRVDRVGKQAQHLVQVAEGGDGACRVGLRQRALGDDAG